MAARVAAVRADPLPTTMVAETLQQGAELAWTLQARGARLTECWASSLEGVHRHLTKRLQRVARAAAVPHARTASMVRAAVVVQPPPSVRGRVGRTLQAVVGMALC